MWLVFCVIGLTDSLPTRRRRGRPPKWPSGHVGGRSAGMSSVHHVSSTRSTNSMQFSSSGSGDLASKTIVKGNIMYRKTETGEVIASVIKNGPKPAASISTAMSTIRGRPPSEPHVTGSLSLSAAGESSLPADCPVNEDNVERILNESITATQSVRRTLVSLKDDLRRMAGGTVMSPTLSPIHLQHRINIAYKLARAFADYRSTVSTISSSTVASAHPETERPAVCAATQSPQHSTAVATLSPQNTASSTTTTQTVLKPTCSEVKNVSDDLLMSCEPGQD